MRPMIMAALACLTVTVLAAGSGHAQPVAAGPPPVDYTQGPAWLCRPGRADDACGSAQLDALAVDAAGARTPQPFHAAAAPKIDCFYVYPTVSDDPTDYSDMTPDRSEIGVAQSQFARFAAVCRPFAPMYRQLTSVGLGHMLAGGPTVPADIWNLPYADVLAAWRAYLKHDNHGRGVVLVGHSQGTILLQRLLAEEIDGHPAQRLLVSAFLAGDPGLSLAPGRDTGGTLKSIPVCRAAGQTGCVYAWGSYAAADASAHRSFGRPAPGLEAACVDPAAPGGGVGVLKTYLHKPAAAPAGDPPWVESLGGYTAACRSDALGAVLRVSVTAAPYADLRQSLLTAVQRRPGWGLHVLDVNLVQGNMLEDVAAEAATWAGGHR